MTGFHLSLPDWLPFLPRRPRAQEPSRPSATDTVAQWPPRPAKVLGAAERVVHLALSSALQIEHPQGFLFAHMPLPRLVQVPSRRSYKEWLSRTGHLTADFVLCDLSSRVLAVVLMSHPDESARAVRRRRRLERVLQAADVRVLTWRNGWQTDPKALRAALFPAFVAHFEKPGDA